MFILCVLILCGQFWPVSGTKDLVLDVSLIVCRDSTGMFTPATTSTVSAGPPSSIHDSGASLTSTSHLLTQTRDILYPSMQNAVQNAIQNQNVSPKPPHCSMADSITQMKAAGQYMGQHAYQRSQLEAKLCQHNSNTMNSIN